LAQEILISPLDTKVCRFFFVVHKLCVYISATLTITMLLRQAGRLAAGSRGAGAVARPMFARAVPTLCRAPLSRNFVSRSLPRLGHNLEDHFDLGEYTTKIQGPFPEYVVFFLMFWSSIFVIGPLLHSNYYFTGRFLPKDQGNTQLCDNSW